MSVRISLTGALLVILAGGALGLANENWPSFRTGDNASVNAKHLPVEWAPTEGIAWYADLPGYGQSSPVVWRDRVFLTAVAGKNQEHCLVMAYAAATGERLWLEAFEASTTKKNSYMVSRAASTPTVDENGLYVLFPSGDLFGLSHDGRLRWRRSLFEEYGPFKNAHGYGASLAQSEDGVFVLVDHRGPSYLLAVSKESGQTLWKTERESRSSWASPAVAEVDGRTQVVVSSGGTVDGYDVATGKRLWTFEAVTGNMIVSASVSGDRVYVGASPSRRPEPDSSVSAVESNCCLWIGKGAEGGCELLWRAEHATCHYAGPLVHDGCVYYVNSIGGAYCVDAATGKVLYAERIGDPCWAQPIGVGNRVYFFRKDGITTVIRSGPEFEILATNRLWDRDNPPLPEESYEYEPEGPDDPRPRQPRAGYVDPIVYGVAAVDGAFFVRTGTRLYCVSNSRLRSNAPVRSAAGRTP